MALSRSGNSRHSVRANQESPATAAQCAEILDTIQSNRVEIMSIVESLRSEHRDNFKKLESKIEAFEKRVTALEAENGGLKREMRVMKVEFGEKIDYLENYSRRENIIIHGMDQPSGKETWEECEEKVVNMLNKKCKMSKDLIKFERVHRVAKPNNGKQLIIARCQSFKIRENIMKEKHLLKGTEIFINEDFSKEVRAKRAKLRQHLNAAREEGKRAALSFDHLIIDGVNWVLDDSTNSIIKKTSRFNSTE